MHLTLHTDYALRMLLYLHAHEEDGPASVTQIADAYGISHNHLAKVAGALARLGWVQSTRGRHGGLTLEPAALRITVGDIVRATETNRRLVECFGDDSACPIEPACGLKHALAKAERAFLDILDGYTLHDLVAQPRKLRVLLSIGATR